MNALNLMRAMLFVFLIFAFESALGQETTFSSHQNYRVEGASRLLIASKGSEIVIKSTKGSRILIEAQITSTLSPTYMEYLFKTDRYKWNFSLVDEQLIISAPRQFDKVVMKGKSYIESVRYIILVPESLRISRTENLSY